VSKLRVD